MESIDALAKAVNEFDGGMVLVSHDMRLISQVAKEIWICDHKTITQYKGDINHFKMDMRAQMHLEDDKKGSAPGKGKLRGDASVMKKTDEDLKKEAKKKEKAQASNGAPPTPASNLELDSLLASKQREEKKDAFDVSSVKTSLPSTEPAGDTPKPRYIPPHLRNKK